MLLPPLQRACSGQISHSVWLSKNAYLPVGHSIHLFSFLSKISPAWQTLKVIGKIK